MRGRLRSVADDEDPVIADAIAKLEAEDAGAAREAEAALDWLTAGEGLEVLTQERLQHFLWYGLPMKWLTDTDHHRRIVDALARAFELLGLSRYAALCRSETTAEVLDAYERSDAEGKKAFHKADLASGIRVCAETTATENAAVRQGKRGVVSRPVSL